MQVNIKELKNQLRAEVKAKRREMTPDKRDRLDAKIARRVSNMWVFREAETVIAYASLPIEVGTKRLLETAKQQGKRIALPLCVSDKGQMEFYIVRDENDLQKGMYSIMEPDPKKCERLFDMKNSICIVPALSFDEDGFRLGFGKGYYDRFLSRYEGKTIGIIYNDFIVESLPHGRYDKQVDHIMSESRLINTVSKHR